VAEAPVHLECRYMQTVQLPAWNPKVSNAIVIGEVIGVHIADEFIAGGRVDVGKLRPIARLGYMDYAVIDTIFSLDRPR
ncbi:MAG: flavin reductase family protein, partial [Alphaproteobacteria bacterium]